MGWGGGGGRRTAPKLVYCPAHLYRDKQETFLWTFRLSRLQVPWLASPLQTFSILLPYAATMAAVGRACQGFSEQISQLTLCASADNAAGLVESLLTLQLVDGIMEASGRLR